MDLSKNTCALKLRSSMGFCRSFILRVDSYTSFEGRYYICNIFAVSIYTSLFLRFSRVIHVFLIQHLSLYACTIDVTFIYIYTHTKVLYLCIYLLTCYIYIYVYIVIWNASYWYAYKQLEISAFGVCPHIYMKITTYMTLYIICYK